MYRLIYKLTRGEGPETKDIKAGGSSIPMTPGQVFQTKKLQLALALLRVPQVEAADASTKTKLEKAIAARDAQPKTPQEPALEPSTEQEAQ